jgi:methionyl-tRNA formyltransferase
MPDGSGRFAKCKVFDAVLGGDVDGASDAEVVSLEADAIGVASVGRLVWLRGVQMEGKRRMTVREYLAGNAVRLGLLLDGRP